MTQLSLLESPPPVAAADPSWSTWRSPDDWETPKPVARAIAGHINLTDRCRPIDRVIVEAGAGTGAIARFLPHDTHCVESNPARVEMGKAIAPHCKWHGADFLEWEHLEDGTVDLVIGNPPFSQAAAFLSRAMELIHDRGRVIFLLPCDTVHKPTFLSAVGGCFTHAASPVVGRIAYLKDGRAVAGRQVYDSIFTFWHYPEQNPNLIHQ